MPVGESAVRLACEMNVERVVWLLLGGTGEVKGRDDALSGRGCGGEGEGCKSRGGLGRLLTDAAVGAVVENDVVNVLALLLVGLRAALRRGVGGACALIALSSSFSQ